MKIKKVLFQENAREKIRAGVDQVAQAVKITLGPRGRTVLLENDFGQTQVVNSGVIVAKSIVLEDEFENMGAQLLKEVATRTSEMAGDGTTTATVLAQSMVHEGLKYLSGGMNPMDLRRGIDMAIAALVKELANLAKPCVQSQEVRHVATISANNDRSIGSLIADAIDKVGPEGAISIEDGSGLTSILEIAEGMQFERGYLSSYFVNNLEKQSVVLNNPSILIYEEKINAIDSLLPLLEEVSNNSANLLLIAEDFSTEVLATLVINSLQGSLKCCPVKSPEFGEYRKEVLRDISTIVGGLVLGPELGKELKQAKLADLGKAKRVEIHKDRTAIIGGAGQVEDIKNRVASLKRELEQEKSEYSQEQLKKRIGKLSGGAAIIKIGAATEAELKERKLRVEDALHATRAAVEEGIVPGGGVALLRIGRVLSNLTGATFDEDSGIKVVAKSIEAPIKLIAENAGCESQIIFKNVVEAKQAGYGFNAATRSYGSMIEMGVIDPAKVTRLALQNAASIASLILATDCIIATKKEDNKSSQNALLEGAPPYF